MEADGTSATSAESSNDHPLSSSSKPKPKQPGGQEQGVGKMGPAASVSCGGWHTVVVTEGGEVSG